MQHLQASALSTLYRSKALVVYWLCALNMSTNVKKLLVPLGSAAATAGHSTTKAFFQAQARCPHTSSWPCQPGLLARRQTPWPCACVRVLACDAAV